MIFAIVFAAVILTWGIIITVLLCKGKSLNITITHINKDNVKQLTQPEPQNVSHETLSADELRELEEAANAGMTSDEIISMDGVISEVNKVMGIETITPEDKENK